MEPIGLVCLLRFEFKGFRLLLFKMLVVLNLGFGVQGSCFRVLGLGSRVRAEDPVLVFSGRTYCSCLQSTTPFFFPTCG